MDYRGPVTQEMIEEIRKKNEEKLQKAREYLGDKWIVDPKNHVKRKTPFLTPDNGESDECND